MREIRYRFIHRGRMPDPYGRWFADARGATLHGTGFRFEPRATSMTLVGFASHVEPLANALRAHPAPGALRWDVKVGDADMVLVEATVPEPLVGAVTSSFRVAHDVLGSRARLSFSMRRGATVHRILLPEDVPTEPLWGRLVAWMEGFAAATRADMRCELERMASRHLEEDPSDPEFLPAVETAFDLGALDRPPLASVAQVSRFLGLPEPCVDTYLHEAHAKQEWPA